MFDFTMETSSKLHRHAVHWSGMNGTPMPKALLWIIMQSVNDYGGHTQQLSTAGQMSHFSANTNITQLSAPWMQENSTCILHCGCHNKALTHAKVMLILGACMYLKFLIKKRLWWQYCIELSTMAVLTPRNSSIASIMFTTWSLGAHRVK